MNAMLEYSEIDSPIHRLSGASKLLALILWAIASMVTYNTFVLGFMFIFSIVVFKISKIEFKKISFIVYLILIFLLINNIAIFIFSPMEGVKIYDSRTDLFTIAGPYTVTLEQLFYQLNVTLKYFSIIPIALLFIIATNPSEFAASLNKIGISYRAAYSVSIALRYIPDIQRDYEEISFAQQSRGIDMSKKEKLSRRIKNSFSIIMPLIFSSLDKIETISTAMELRGFGSKRNRTWYSERKFKVSDYITVIIMVVILAISIGANIKNGGRFYNPFI
ncbi:MAG: energy-coupling factor transporter transmembrane component T [Clostridiaceae bacterium]|nr:energy-coupling factor transporter transmembrane component T [Clostridiaceae bacterium]